MQSTGGTVAMLGGLAAVTAVLGGAVGGACGWVGATVFDEAGFELNDSDSFGFVGMIGGAELALLTALSVISSSGRVSSSSSLNLTPKGYWLLGLASFVVMGFTMGLVGMSQTLEFNDNLMSNLEQNERIWSSGAVCATGAAMIYLGATIVAGMLWGANEIKNKLPTRSINS